MERSGNDVGVRREDGAAGVPGDGRPQVLGGLLIGGASRRMGRPKALLHAGGPPLAERVAAALRPHTRELFLLGEGPVPAGLATAPRLADHPLPPAPLDDGPAPSAPDARRGALPGPLAGILAALHARPGAAWVICPCDLPAIRAEAVGWLLEQRRDDRRVILPLPHPDGPPQPLFALYEPAAVELVERLVADGVRAPRRLRGLPGVAVVAMPPALEACWSDIDTPEELARLDR